MRLRAGSLSFVGFTVKLPQEENPPIDFPQNFADLMNTKKFTAETLEKLLKWYDKDVDLGAEKNIGTMQVQFLAYIGAQT